jgi:UDP-2,3-diacylglucosamine pyrophosphatase LpxH
MVDPRSLLIFSDLHLARERDCGLFRADREVADAMVSALEDAGPTNIILAGDFLDFLVPGKGEDSLQAFEPKRAATTTAAIIEHHPEVFDALACLARSERHELFILGGNHDPEMLLPEVQEVIEHRLAPRSRLHWRVSGESVRICIQGCEVLVAHGDLFDNWNRIDHYGLRRALNRISFGFDGPKEHGYVPPPGSLLVVEHVLRLRQQYPWLDALKPEREAVFPILHEVLNPSDRPGFRQYLKHALRSFKPLVLGQAGKRLSAKHIVRSQPPAQSGPLARLDNWLAEPILRGSASAGDSLAHLISKLRKVSAEDGTFDIFHPDATVPLLQPLFGRGVDLIILGHTHAAKAIELPEGLYLNAGTWGRLLELPHSSAPDEAWGAFLANLWAGKDLGDARPTFVRVSPTPDGSGAYAELLAWRGGGESSCAEFRFLSEHRKWERSTL